MKYRVAIQGYAASFHDVAARQLLGDNIKIIACDTFAEVFACVEDGRADLGVAAVANSIYGGIAGSEALFKTANITELDEAIVPVEQCLLAFPGVTFKDITDIYSHPVALAQCADYLADYLPKATLHDHADTAESAADVAKWSNRTRASIASSAAADLYGLKILGRGIQTDKLNYTRFVLFEKRV